MEDKDRDGRTVLGDFRLRLLWGYGEWFRWVSVRRFGGSDWYLPWPPLVFLSPLPVRRTPSETEGST